MSSSRFALALAAGTLALLASLPARAADVPRQMVFQGRLVRADGSPESSPQDLRFALYTLPTGSAPVWEESHPATPVTNGYYAVVLGEAQALPATAFTGQVLYLGVSLVGQSELTPRLPIVSVPYALRAGDSERLGGLDAASFAGANHGHPTATASANGFMSTADRTKLNALASSYGPSLTVTGSPTVLNVNLATSGGLNGSSSAAARADHSHPTATSAANGLMASTDKAKLDAQLAVTATGAGLTLSAGTLSANFTPSGGNNGTATTVARGDHKHAPALACTYRRTSGAGTAPAATYCAATEDLMGGSCAEYDTNNGKVLSGGEPVGITLSASAPPSGGGPGFQCTAANSANGIMATAMCCRVVP